MSKPVDDGPYLRFALEIVGNVKIRERGEPAEDGIFKKSVVLVDEDKGIEFGVRLEAEEVVLDMATYHVVDPETGKGYHATLSLPLDRRAALHLIAALECLVKLL